MKTVGVTLQNELRELDRLRRFLEQAAHSFSMDERTLYRLNLICDELVTNIISYGYDDVQLGGRSIELELTELPDGVEIRITDDGVPFDPLSRPKPELDEDVEERGIGGLGIHFARSLASGASYKRDGDRNVLRLIMNRRTPEEERTG